MNLWFDPQISEHCPFIFIVFLVSMFIELIRPGTQSIFVILDGIVHEWITSFDLIINRLILFFGMIIV